jgi:hypothetical protein
MGLGPLMVGFLSDYFAADYGDESIRFALVAVSSVAVLAAIAFYRGARRVEEDLV